MGKKIDQVGTYRGETIEAALQTSKSGLPMFVVTLRADERYVEDQSDLDFYVEQGVIEEAVPQWIDWSEHGETIRNYMLLFKPEEGETEFTEDNATVNYKQIQTAFGWDGASFNELSDGTFIGTNVLFRCAEEEDPKYGPCRVAWVDEFDAPPQRELKSVDATTIAELSNRLRITKKKTKPAAAAAPKVAKPSASTASQSTTKKKATKKTTAKKTATPAPQAAPAAAPAPAAATATAEAPSSQEFTKDEAWNDIYTKAAAADNETEVITDAWIAGVAEVAEDAGVDEESFTGAHWAKVRKIVLRDLGVAG